MKSRFDEPAFASSRFAPMEVPDFSSWSTRHLTPGLVDSVSASRATAHPSLNERSRISCEFVGMGATNAGHAPVRGYVRIRIFRQSLRLGLAKNATLNSGLHFEFCILHFAFL